VLNEQPLFVQPVVKPGCTTLQLVSQPAVYTIQLVVKPLTTGCIVYTNIELVVKTGLTTGCTV